MLIIAAIMVKSRLVCNSALFDLFLVDSLSSDHRCSEWQDIHTCMHASQIPRIKTYAYLFAPGTEFDGNVKQWRFFADICHDTANFVEFVAPFYPLLVSR